MYVNHLPRPPPPELPAAQTCTSITGKTILSMNIICAAVTPHLLLQNINRLCLYRVAKCIVQMHLNLVFHNFFILFYQIGVADQNVGVALDKNMFSILPCDYTMSGNLRVNSAAQPLRPGILAS